jgi:hypothetical protein
LAIARVVDRVQCEVYEAIQELKLLTNDQGVPQYDWVDNYVAKAVLTLQINTDGTAAPEVSLLGPFDVGTYSLGIGGGITGGANRIATYGFNLIFAMAKSNWCRDKANDGFPPLQGNLGLKEWFTTVLRSHNDNDPFPRPKSLSHRLEFTLDGNFKISPAYVLTRSKGNGAFSLHRKDFQTLDIAIEYIDPNLPDYTKVCVVNLPAPCDQQKLAIAPGPAKPSAQKATPPDQRAPQRQAQPKQGGRIRAPAQSKTRELSPEVQQRLDRALQNLELRSIAPRF